MSEETKQPLVAVIAENAVLTQASSLMDVFYYVTAQISLKDVKQVLELNDALRGNLFFKYGHDEMPAENVEHFAIVSQAWLEKARRTEELLRKQLKDRCEEWHISESRKSLQDWLDLSDEEYERWVKEGEI